MPATYTLTYLSTGHTVETWLLRGVYYELADGSAIDVTTRIAWCRKCREFTDGELIESPDEIRQQIKALRTPESAAYKFAEWNNQQIQAATGKTDSNWRESNIAALESRLKWRLERNSPPKCLVCGSTDIVFPLSKDETVSEINIPDIGTVRVESAGISSTEFANWFYTPEGDRIPRYATPTYWGVPDKGT
jgi:hypothetical protein